MTALNLAAARSAGHRAALDGLADLERLAQHDTYAAAIATEELLAYLQRRRAVTLAVIELRERRTIRRAVAALHEGRES